MIHYILGLDISTTCTGWALLSLKSGELTKYGKIITSEEKNLFAQAHKIQQALDKEITGSTVVTVGVEQLNSFKGGATTRALCGISYIVQDYIYKHWGLLPNQLNTGTIKACFTQGYKIWKGVAKKPDMISVANERYNKNFKFVPPTKNRKTHDSDDDIVDAIATAYTLRQEIGEALVQQLTESA